MKIRISLILLFSTLISFAASNYEANIQMLNYIGALSERIKEIRKDPLELHNLRDEIYNDIITTEIDQRTKGVLVDYQGAIKDFTLLSRQRDRMQLIIDNMKADALNNAIPNPQSMISIALSNPNPFLMAATVGTMITNSISSYKSSMARADMEELKMKWELEDKDLNIFEEISKNAWSYRVDVSNKYGISNSLNEKKIQKIFELKKEDVIERRLKELENPEIQELYTEAHYQPYYLILAETYYQSEKWKECVQAYQDYEKNPTRLFEKDHEAAKILPKVIHAAQKYMGSTEIVNFIKEYNQKLIKETSDEEWELRYFAAVNSVNLANLDPENRQDHLKHAFDLFTNNISKLSRRQDSLLAKYILPIDEEIPKDLNDDKKKAYKTMIKLEKKERKNRTLPLDKALYTNMEMAYAIAKANSIINNEWKKFIPVVKKSIVNMQLRKKYGLNISDSGNFSFDGKYFYAPASFVSSNIKISMVLTDEKNKKFTLKNVPFDFPKINRPNDKDLVTDQHSKEFIEQLNNFTAELKMNVKPFKIDFDTIKSIVFNLSSYNETIQIPLVNDGKKFVFSKIK